MSDNEKAENVIDSTAADEIERREYEILTQSRNEDAAALSAYLNYLWLIYADFHITVVEPFIQIIEPPTIIKPAYDQERQMYENVYTILDYGYAFRTSRGEDASLGSTAMGKLYNTIHKIIRLVLKRVQDEASGGTGKFDPNAEIKIGLFGHELGKRKAFALIMDWDINANIVNFDPRIWGERFISNLKNMIASGRGYPPDLKRVSERVAPGGSLSN